MDLIPSNKYIKERKVAEIIVEKLKYTAQRVDSTDPTHRNGVKYMMSKQLYESTIHCEFEARKIIHSDRMVIRELINRKLKKV